MIPSTILLFVLSAGDVDISSVRGELRVFAAGPKHIIVASWPALHHGPLFFGDRAVVYAQIKVGAGKDQSGATHFHFWDGRANVPSEGEVAQNASEWTLTCETRVTKLVPLSEEESAQVLDKLSFKERLWTRRAHLLARDTRGEYYYVDQAWQPEGNTDFRVYKGPKGRLKKLKMINVVNDTEGQIFTTQNGALRLVTTRNEVSWIEGGHAQKLTTVDVIDNRRMVYAELGVYAGQRLGTPCDEL
jgi:hypothetical protein